MAKKRKKPKMEFRYYQMPAGSPILALLGQKWVQNYGNDAVSYTHLMTMQCWNCAVWKMDRLWNLMILQMLFKRKSWHQERGKKSVGIVSGTPSVKARRADGRNAKKNRVTE